jgi:hypothetical protein
MASAYVLNILQKLYMVNYTALGSFSLPVSCTKPLCFVSSTSSCLFLVQQRYMIEKLQIARKAIDSAKRIISGEFDIKF